MARCTFSKTYKPLWIEREEWGASNNVRISGYHYWRIKPRKKVKCCHFTLALNTYVPFSALWNEWILKAHVNNNKTENLNHGFNLLSATFHWWERLVNHRLYFPFYVLQLQMDLTSGNSCYQKAFDKKKMNEWMNEMKLFENSGYFVYMLNLWWGPQGMQWWKLNEITPHKILI